MTDGLEIMIFLYRSMNEMSNISSSLVEGGGNVLLKVGRQKGSKSWDGIGGGGQGYSKFDRKNFEPFVALLLFVP